MDEKSFLGRGWSFPPEFGRESQTVRMVDDEEDIRQSLTILFTTRSGERFNRSYNGDLNEFIHEPMDQTTFRQIKDRIEKAVLLYEPRIELKEVHFDQSRVPHGVLMIEINYLILRTCTEANMVFPFYLKG